MMKNVMTVIWFILWIFDQTFTERVLVEKRRSILPGDQREKFSTSGLDDLVVEFNSCQGNRPYISLYFCSTSKVKLKVELGRDSTVLWNCDSADSRNSCSKIVEHQPVQFECNSFAPVWISWRISGKILFGAGPEVGKGLHFDASIDNTNCTSVTEWDWGTEIEEDTVQMALHRSEGENRCYLTRAEKVGRVTCGDRYTDEVWCLSCGCCYDQLSTDQMPCFYPQDNKQRKKSCERTFEEVLGAVEFRSVQNPTSNATDPIVFLVLLKQTIETANVGLSFGDGTPPVDGIQLDRSTPIPDCSSACKYVDWLRAVVTHFYTDAGVFEPVLTITDSSRGAVPFVLRKASVKVKQRFEPVLLKSSVAETDETTFQLPSFNPVRQKEFSCNSFEVRVLSEEDSSSENRAQTTTERWNENERGWNNSLAFEENNSSVAFNGQNETLWVEEQNQTTVVEGTSDSPAVNESSDLLPSDKWNGILTFESESNITFRAVIESNCSVPGVPSYIIFWSLRRLARHGSDHHDDEWQKLVFSAIRFNIPSDSLSEGMYEVQLEVRMFDALRTQINISKAVTSFEVVHSQSEDVRSFYFIDDTVSLTNNVRGPGFSYQWFCTTTVLRDVSEIEAPTDDRHPFGDCMKNTAAAKALIPSARNQLFPAAFLQFSSLPAYYYFHSITRGNNSSEEPDILSRDVTVVVLRPGRPPVVRIKCITGCSRPHAKNHSIWLEGACVNCRGNAESLTYAWSFTYAQQSNAHLRSFNWAEDSATGNNGSYIVVQPNKFMMSLAQDEFSFTLTVSRADMTSSEASYHFPKERPEYDLERNQTARAHLRTGMNASSCRHYGNVFLISSATLFCLSCQLGHPPLYNIIFFT